MSMHLDDPNGNILNTPIMEAYLQKFDAAKLKFAELKKSLIKTYLPEYIISIAGDWELDYTTNTLIVEVPSQSE